LTIDEKQLRAIAKLKHDKIQLKTTGGYMKREKYID
jgi:hypothetical protein